jgi:hypothetical protein
VVASKGIVGKRAWQIDALGLLLLPRCQLHTTKGKFSSRSYDFREEDSQQLPFPPLGQLKKKKEREERKFLRLGLTWPNSNLNLNSSKLGLKIILGWFPEVSNIFKSSRPKFDDF